MQAKRPPATREEAQAILDLLMARHFTGPLPELSTGTTLFEWCAHLAALPLADTVALHGRALFAPGSLPETARQHALQARPGFFAELGAALGVSARVLHAAVRARRFPLEPPRPLVGYEYLGSFCSEGTLVIADPCHLHESSRVPSAAFSLSHEVAALAGPWHVLVRNGRDDARDRTAELVVIHERGFDLVATQPLASIAVDAGMAGVYDPKCPALDTHELVIEGLLHDRGAFAHSGYGDGIYPVYAGLRGGQIAKLRLAFLEESRRADASVPGRPSQPYAATTAFAVGDTIAHPKFGTGLVMRVVGNKIDVDFGGSLRTLLHGKR